MNNSVFYLIFILFLSFAGLAKGQEPDLIQPKEEEFKKHFVFYDLTLFPFYYSGYGRILLHREKVDVYGRVGTLFFSDALNVFERVFEYGYFPKNHIGMSLEVGIIQGQKRDKFELGVRAGYFYYRFKGFWLARFKYRTGVQDFKLLHLRIGWRHHSANGKMWYGLSVMPGILLDYNHPGNENDLGWFVPTVSFAIGRRF